MTQRLGCKCERAIEGRKTREGSKTVVEAEETAWREVLRLGAQMGCWAQLQGVTLERTSLHPGRQSWGSDFMEPPTCAPGQSWRTSGLFSPGRHSSPEETSPLDTSRDAPQDSLIFLAVGWTDRQTDIRLQAVWLLVEGHEKWKCICCD